MNHSDLKRRLQAFTDYLRFEKRYSPHTVRAYQDDLTQFFEFAAGFGESRITQIRPSLVRSWLASFKDQGYHSKSINRKISSLRSFFKQEMRLGKLKHSPVTGVQAPKAGRRLPVYVEEKDMDNLLSRVEFPETWKGQTDRLLLALFYHTGIRLSELVNLQEGQVNFANRSIKVLGKGNKERIIPIHAGLGRQIRAYIREKRRAGPEFDPKVLFTGPKGRKLYPKYAYLTVKKYLGLVTSLEKKSPHILRHSFATHLANAGADLNAVKELLGHASLAATQVYTHNSIQKLQEVHRKAHPKA
jgi:integrase/recombinase XerC